MSAEITIRFEAPAPPILRSTQSLAEFTEALRARPGEWALLGQNSTSAGSTRSAAYDIRHGYNRAFAPARAYEAEMRTLFGEHRIYVRYVGGGAA